MSVDLSFVVETINLRDEGDFEPLDAALAHVRKQTLSRDRYEVIVVVNPTLQPRLRSHLDTHHPAVRVVEAPGSHYYEQKNVGARAARGEIVGFVDADCEPVPTWGEAVLEIFSRNDDTIGAVQGAYDTPGSDRSAVALHFLLTTFGHQAGRTERVIDSLAASNCAFRRADLLATPFDEKAFFHGPDVRMATAIRVSGRHVLLTPDAANRHDHEPGVAGMLGRGAYWGYCFLRLRHDETDDIHYVRLFRGLGPLAPCALVPMKAARDIRQLVAKRRELSVRPFLAARCAGLMILNAVAVGVGAARYQFGLTPPPAPQVTIFGERHETARVLGQSSAG
jgi:hypothetical protein